MAEADAMPRTALAIPRIRRPILSLVGGGCPDARAGRALPEMVEAARGPLIPGLPIGTQGPSRWGAAS